MIGALIGDIAGSRFEFANYRKKDFQLFAPACAPTDDSIMSLAVARAILEAEAAAGEGAGAAESAAAADAADWVALPGLTVKYMQQLGRLYPDGGYGRKFFRWLYEEDPQPYGSLGNGSAMRVSPCGFAARSLEEAQLLARLTAGVTHDHPEGLKGAEAIASAIWLARAGRSKGEIRTFIEENYYVIDFTLDEIRPTYEFNETCPGSVPQALEAFFEGEDFEDVIRCAISLGGDSDTIAAIAGGIAEAYYGVPQEIREAAHPFLDARLTGILTDFEARYPGGAPAEAE